MVSALTCGSDTALAAPTAPIRAAGSASAEMVAIAAALAVPTFAGGDTELAALGHASGPDRITRGGPGTAAVIISALSGTAGIGKTAPRPAMGPSGAPHVSPTGSCTSTCRGFDPTGTVLDPAIALRSFLDALGIPAHRIPLAWTTGQPLPQTPRRQRVLSWCWTTPATSPRSGRCCPARPGCLVIVDQRTTHPADTTGGAHPLTLDLLSSAQARDLLARRIGTTESRPSPSRRGHHRPLRAPSLALAIAPPAPHPSHLPLSALAAELHDAAGSLDASTATCRHDIRDVFSGRTHPEPRRGPGLFRLLGLHPGPDSTAPAAASLVGSRPGRCARLLAELTSAQPAHRTRPGRYPPARPPERLCGRANRQHRRRGGSAGGDAPDLDHYLHTAHAAATLLDPFMFRSARHRPYPG